MMVVLLIYYGLLQLIGFFTMGIDKRRARKGEWRVPERRLWIFAWLGGGLGLWIGMTHFRHKTKHLSFRIGFPFFTILHASLVVAGYFLINYHS